ncbi:ABC transporter permease [Pacificoceanicola onchidii]|uniref:ABC transporter permease n=1 Tax=Pacificoceanicola onchidii TaxID=2562685 RepID=UPI0014560413|nr:ABC transporter permease subunit [Pacificoceanicola onchidii]
MDSRIDVAHSVRSKGLPGPVSVCLILCRQQVLSRLGSIWIYVLATVICLIAAVFGGGFLRAFETETVLVTSDPLIGLNTVVLAFLALVFGLRLSTAMAWEREHRTLEVLLVGPAGHGAILTAKFVSELVVLIGMLLAYSAYLVLAAPLGAGTIGVADLSGVWLGAVFVLPMLGFGLLVSNFFASVRAAVVCYLIVAVALIGVSAVTQGLRVLPPQELSLSLLYLRSGLVTAHEVLQHVSPVAYLSDLFTNAISVSVLSLARGLAAIALGLALLGLSIFISKRRGSQ